MQATPAPQCAAALVASALMIIVSGCGAMVSGTPERQETNMSRLDVGHYRIVPRALGDALNNRQARIRESQRLADYVALPSEADPALTQLQDAGLVIDHNGLDGILVNDTFEADTPGLRGGWVVTGQIPPATGSAPPARTMSIAVIELPDAARATAAGSALEHDDFTFASANQPVPMPKYPQARAHWQPTVASLGTWLTHGPFVVFVKVDAPAAPPDLGALVDRTQRALDAELPLLDDFSPTPADRFEHLPLDPDGLLGHTLPSARQTTRQVPDGVYAGRGAIEQLDDPDIRALTTGDIDRAAIGGAKVFHSRTGAAARALWARWRPASRDHLLPPPPGIPGNIECFSDTQESEPDTDECVFQLDHYTVLAKDPNLDVLHQKVAAQYVLLTDR
ncbi:hypothetical protein KO481_08320 [Nocardia sp. NEAU-G5]|uniref:Uncharacterized protein n=1 Tax=Nocardia albiluteola TaxID=2842303 RepID=A0ABS6AX14_9NOCA|nr:hypothetical protein [Nocardia albiluteola]MBU3061528.1 hypothetical protein [Nocardia albiluteola]